MGLFTKNELGISSLHQALKLAFEHVKRDTAHIFEWLKYFHDKHQQYDERLAQIEKQLIYMPKNHHEIKQIIDHYYSYDHVLEKIKGLSRRLDDIEHQKQERKISLKERLVRKITRNSKDYIKSVIISFINKYERISAPQLREILVDEQGLCSKSSFYRLLAELEQEQDIGSIQTGKEKLYLSKTKIIK